MTLESRNNQIKKYRREGKTLDWIGRRFNISKERVRQVLKDIKPVSARVSLNSYKDFLYKASSRELLDESVRLSVRNRTKGIVFQRQLFVKFMHDKLDFSFLQLAQMLKRDHTTIMYLYKTKYSSTYKV